MEATVRLVQQADLAHLACHGRLRADNPLFSALELADGTPALVMDLLEGETLASHLAARSALSVGETVAINPHWHRLLSLPESQKENHQDHGAGGGDRTHEGTIPAGSPAPARCWRSRRR